MKRFDTLFEAIKVALEAIRANRIRAGLTILGVAIGVAVVVSMAAMITGIRTSILSTFEASGPNNFTVMPFDFTAVRISSNRPPWWGKPEVSDQEIRLIRSQPGVQDIVTDVSFQTTITAGAAEVSNVATNGDTSEWPTITIGEFAEGRNFTAAEVQRARTVVVISDFLALELFGELDPINRRIRLRGPSSSAESFTVIGTYTLKDNIFAQANRFFAIVPHTTAKKRLNALNRFTFRTVTVIPEEGVLGEVVQERVTAALRASRGLRPNEENNFALVQSSQLVDLFNRLTSVFFLVMLALSSVGLMVGGIGVIGIMLISVTERTREIGVRKAVGATRREILWQFLVEAAVLTGIGGAVGMIMGGALSWLVAHFSPLPAEIPIWAVLVSLGMAIFTGMLFGLLPAVRASRLQPVVALRHE